MIETAERVIRTVPAWAWFVAWIAFSLVLGVVLVLLDEVMP